MLCSSLFIGFIVILLKTTPKEAILSWNQHIKSWQKIKRISDLPTLIFFGMLVEARVFLLGLNSHGPRKEKESASETDTLEFHILPKTLNVNTHTHTLTKDGMEYKTSHTSGKPRGQSTPIISHTNVIIKNLYKLAYSFVHSPESAPRLLPSHSINTYKFFKASQSIAQLVY